MTVVAIRLLDRSGRRPLLLWGAALMGLALTALAIVFATHSDSGAGSAVAILGLMLYVGAFAVSLGPIFWLMNGEIYPLGVRSKAAAVGTMANWLFNFIVSLTFLLLVDALGRGGAFFFYAAICAVTFFFCRMLVPETKGKRLWRRFRRCSRSRGRASAARRGRRRDCIAADDAAARTERLQGARGPPRGGAPTRTCASSSRPTPIAAPG